MYDDIYERISRMPVYQRYIAEGGMREPKRSCTCGFKFTCSECRKRGTSNATYPEDYKEYGT